MALSISEEEQLKIDELKAALKAHLQENNTAIQEEEREELENAMENSHFLFKYLRGRKLQVDKALETILMYAEVKRVVYPEYFLTQVPPYLSLAIERKMIGLLSQKDELGRTYILVDSVTWDDTLLSSEECGNTLRYIIEALMNSVDFLDNGVIILDNAKGIQMRHSRNGMHQAQFYRTFWKAFPVKLKAIIYFNASVGARAIFPMARPFIYSKAVQRMYVSSGLGDLHKRVPLDILPKSLGGNLVDEMAFLPQDKLLALALENRK